MYKDLLVAGSVAALLVSPVAPAAAQQPTTTPSGQQEQNAQKKTSPGTAGQAKPDDWGSWPEMQPPPQDARGNRPVKMVLVTTVDQVESNPEAYMGLLVSVHARVDDVYGKQSFKLSQAGWSNAGWGGDWMGRDLIVALPSAPSTSLQKGDFVTVVGRVRPYVRAEIEREFSWFGSIPDLNVELEGRPILIAEMARKSDGAELTKPASAASYVLVSDPGDIAKTPGRFYGQTVSVYAEVEDVWSPHAFTLDEDRWFAGPDVLVFNPAPVQTANLDDKMVTVVGTVRPFVRAEFERDYDWFGADRFDRAELERLERRPVIVASSILSENTAQVVTLTPLLTIEQTQKAVEARQPGTRTTGTQAAQKPAGETRGTGTTATSAAGSTGGTATSGTTTTASETKPASGTKTTGTATSGQAGSGTGPVTSLDQLVGVTNPSTIFERKVDVTGAQVQQVVDARTFWVGPSADRRVLVIADPGALPSGQSLESGQTVSISGTVAQTPSGATGPSSQVRYYVRATAVRR